MQQKTPPPPIRLVVSNSPTLATSSRAPATSSTASLQTLAQKAATNPRLAQLLQQLDLLDRLKPGSVTFLAAVVADLVCNAQKRAALRLMFVGTLTSLM